MPRVVVIGSGPAGLAAAECLASAGVHVTLATMGHHLGGKASSWRHRTLGHVVEHGQHVMMGFYDEMRALLRRSGVDPDATSWDTGTRFVIWEDRDQRAHHLRFVDGPFREVWEGLQYTGMSLAEKANFFTVLLQGLAQLATGVPEELDDTCLTAWCLERGLGPAFCRTSIFRCSREAQLNWPGEISAYAMLKTIAIAGRDHKMSDYRLPAGGMSEIWWEPVAARVERLGGRVVRRMKLTGIETVGGRLVALRLAPPLPHPPDQPYFEGTVPTGPDTEERWSDLDAAILTLPPPALAEVLPAELAALPALAGVAKLSSVAPLGLHVWHRNSVTRGPRTVVAGLGNPLGFVVDNKPVYPEYRDNPAVGAALHFVGQETGFEGDDDETLLQRCLASVRRIDGWEGMDREGVIGSCVVRSRLAARRYWNAEPGSLRHKPQSKTPVEGLFLGGDWIRTPLDFPCMENAVRGGRIAAHHALAYLGVGP